MNTVSLADTRPGLGRLTRVELRKMTDTRAGLWLQLAIALITVLVVVASVLGGAPEDHTLETVLGNAVGAPGLLLPVVGILLVSSEWNQRTALATFVLVPDRRRVLGAKFLAGVALALIALVLCLALSALGVALFGDAPDGAWSLSAGLFGQMVVSLVFAMLTGVAFGAAFLASAPAIVCYFVLPFGIAALATISFLNGIGTWIDQSQSLADLTQNTLSATEWGHVGTTLLVWLVLPALLGGWRIVRGEVR